MTKKKKSKILVIIPARAGSKRISGKNTKLFVGKPLIARTILQAKRVSFVDRIIVDTDSPKIAAISKRYGAEVPYLRPKHLATDKAQVTDAIIHLLGRLQKEEKYKPDYVIILQTTSPLREVTDIERVWQMMKKGGADTVLTVCPTHPQLYYLDRNGYIVSANRRRVDSTNIQTWPPAYILNGCFVYIIKTDALLREHAVVTKKTKAIVCDKWRSVDLDGPEDWVLAEHLFRDKKNIAISLKKFK